MITHRMSTQAPPEPPVRLYKIIALSFLVITFLLLVGIIFVTAKKVTITVIAKQDKKIVSTVAKVSPTALGDSIIGVVTSSIFSYSEKFEPTGNKTIDGIATGVVTIYNKGNTPQTLIKTTRLLTANGILFHLSDRVLVPANGEVQAKVYADKPGAAFVIGPSQFTIPGLSADRQKIVYASSAAPMQGGTSRVGILSQDDLAAAEKTYKENLTAAYANTFSISDQNKIIVSVVSQHSQPSHAVGDSISDFSINGTSTLVAVTYNIEDLKKLLDAALNDKINVATEKFLAADSEPRVTLANYDLKTKTAELNVEEQVSVTLDANVDSLDPQHFFGKKKDEIERYILGLDHVASVDVNFSPSWIFSAPNVPDRVKVIVKNVE